LSLLEFLNSLVEVELEVGLFRELGNDKVVVGIEPLVDVRLVHGQIGKANHFFISEAGTSTPSD